MALTEDKFNQGMTPQQWIDQIKVNKQPILDIYNAVSVPDKFKTQFDGLSEPFKLECSPPIGAATPSARLR